MVDLNRMSGGATAGLLVGALVGILSRLSMRAVALLGHLQPGFSLSGTLLILLLGVFLGVLYGAIFGAVRPLLGRPPLQQGALYGLFFAGLTAIPFLRDPRGELSLISPAVGIALFASLPLVAGLMLGLLAPHFEDGMTRGARAIGWPWLCVVAVAFVLGFTGLMPLMGSHARLPGALWDLSQVVGISFGSVRELNAQFGILFGLTYCAVVLALFVRTAQEPAARLAVLTFLLFVAAFVPTHGLFAGVMDATKIAALASALLKAVAASAFLFLLHLFPDGRLTTRWSRWIVLVGGAGAFLWFILAGTGIPMASWLPESVRLAVVALALLGGLLTIAQRYRTAHSAIRSQIAWPLAAFVLAVCWFLGLWTATFFFPSLRFSGRDQPFAPLSVTAFLWPWLLPPLALLSASLRRGLWAVDPEGNSE